MNKRTSNALLSLILIILSSVILIACHFAYKNIISVVNDEQSRINEAYCSQESLSLGASITHSDDLLTLSWTETPDIEALVGKAALAVSQCHEYKLSAFCAGELCEGGDVSIVLKK